MIKIKQDFGVNYIVVNDFTQSSLARFRHQFLKLEQSDQHIIPIYVDTYGGEVHSLLGMISLIESTEKIVATICDSTAMSCGSILFSSGTKGFRFIGPHAYLMVHQPSAIQVGKLSDLNVSTEYVSTLNKEIFVILDRNTGKKKGFFEKLLFKNSNTDLYINADQAVKYGLADHKGVPRLIMEPSIDYKLINIQNKKAESNKSKTIKKLKIGN